MKELYDMYGIGSGNKKILNLKSEEKATLLGLWYIKTDALCILFLKGHNPLATLV